MPDVTIAEIARRLNGEVEGDGSRVVRGVADIRNATENDLSFAANVRYAADVAATRAAAVLVARAWNKPAGSTTLIRVDDPDRAFAEATGMFAPPPPPVVPGVHPGAVVAKGVELGEGVSVGPLCVVEAGARIGARTVLRANVYVGHEARIGCDGLLYPFSSVRERCVIGDRVILHNGAVIGSDGFGYAVNAQGVRTKIAQIGIVEMGDDVEIGANTTVDRARFGKTRIGNGVKIDNLVQIGHNVVIKDHAVIVAQVGIAGSTEVGARVVMAGQSGAAGHLVIGDGATIAGRAGVVKDVPPGEVWRGMPARPIREVMRAEAAMLRLPELSRKVAELEKRLRELEGKNPPPSKD